MHAETLGMDANRSYGVDETFFAVAGFNKYRGRGLPGGSSIIFGRGRGAPELYFWLCS